MSAEAAYRAALERIASMFDGQTGDRLALMRQVAASGHLSTCSRPPQPIGERMMAEYAKVPNVRHPEGAARITLSAALDAAGPAWADLADAIENGTNYENDTIHVRIALQAVETALESNAATRPLTGGVTEEEAVQIIAQVLWEKVGPEITAQRAADIARDIYLAMSNVSRGVK